MRILSQDKIYRERTEKALREISAPQPRRLVGFLSTRQSALTHEIARECGIGNISHAACGARIALEKQGITIVATLPKPQIKNRYGEISQIHEWRLQVLR